tara:strand:+ start:365 stop:628 length:264 start_codon:yes stop_codon:yes gene_type:complete
MTITINKNKEELILKLKQRLEDSWSGASQIIEELEEFQYEAEKDSTKLCNFYDYDLDELKYDAEILQGKLQESIEKFVRIYNLKEEV